MNLETTCCLLNARMTAAVMTALLAGPIAAQDGIEQRITDLEAREAIRDLIYAYGEALDTRNFVAFSELFAEKDGTWEGGFGSATGREAIFELMDESIGHSDEPVEPSSFHVFTNVRISVQDETATATTKWIFTVPSDDNEPRWLYLGHYEDEFIVQDGRWYFLRRQAFTDIPVE